MRRIFSYLKSSGGFSLAELVVYLGILGITMTVFTGVLDTVTKTQVRESTQNEISGQLNFAVQTMQRLIKNSSIIEGTAGLSTSSISLQMSQAAKSPTKIYLQNNQIYVQEGSSTPQTITTDKISVDSLSFRKFTQPGAKDVVQIDLAISQFQPTTGTTVSRSLRSAISRADAVTFDSDLLPPTDATFNVGAWPSLRWKDGSFSGQVRAGSLCIADDCRGSWGAISGVQGTGSQNYLAKWLTAGSITSSVIYDNGTNIGIGGIVNPGAKLDVNGSIRVVADSSLEFGDSNAQLSGGSSVLTFKTNGSERARITSGGVIGIGTATPDTNYKLTTSGGGIKAESSSTQPAGYFNNTSTGNSIVTGTGAVKLSDLAGTGNRMVVAGADGTLTTQAISTGSVTGTGTANYLTKWTGSTSIATSTIFDNGTGIGIGTTTPTKTLEVIGAVRVSTGQYFSSSTASFYTDGSGAQTGRFGGLLIGTSYDTSPNNNEIRTAANQDLNLNVRGTGNFYLKTTDATKLTVINNGNVGIGTTSPAAKLQIDTSAANGFRFTESGTPGGYYGVFSVDGSGLKIGTNSAIRDVRFQVGNNDKVTIDTDGDVGIATSAPADKLHVVGNATISGIANCGTGTSVLKTDANGRIVCGSMGTGNYVLKTGDTMSGNLNMNGNNILGVNKLTVTTIDPLYDIGGEKYATYASSIAGGVKEEYVGRDTLRKTSSGKFQKAINFSKVEKGSDLWVWHKAIEFSKDNVEAIATPYGEAAQIYYVIQGNTLIFKAESDTDSDAIEFSYRLIGKRYDWRDHPTYAKDQSEPALLIRP